MKTIDKIIVFTYLLILFILLVIISVDTVRIILDPSAHITAYVFINSRESWFERSIANYLIGNLLQFSLAGGLFFIGIKKLLNKSGVKIWNILFYLCLIILIAFLILSYYQWAATGFDH